MAQDTLKYKLIVAGGSAGSLDIILKIISGATLINKIFYIIIIHRKNESDSVLTNLFSSCQNLR